MLKFYTDTLWIDQARHGVNTGGRMTRKRTLLDLRKIAKARLADYWARLFDELFFIYLSGTRGDNADYLYGANYGGFANNPVSAPDSYHTLPVNGRTGAGDWVPSTAATTPDGDYMRLDTIDQAVARASVMGGGSTGIPMIEPCMIDGEEHFVMVMHPYQAFQVRRAAGTAQWMDIFKALTTAEGYKSPIFKGGLGLYNNVVLHQHRAVVRFTNMNTSGSAAAGARALFMGRQAGVIAYGSGGNDMHFDWHEETADHGNQIKVSASAIFGIKKSAFTLPVTNTKTDFGLLAVDSTVASYAGISV